MSKTKRLIRRFSFGCCSAIAALSFAVVVIGLISLVVFFVRYETWERDEREVIVDVAIRDVSDREAVRRELDDRLVSFQQSTVQREVLDVDCEMVNVMFEDMMEEHWGMPDRRDVGVACRDRELDFYVRLGNMWWSIVKVWQRSEGAVDFVVYDVNIGPFSIAGLTFGDLSSSMSRGVSDAIGTMTGESYSGRALEKIYVTEEGLKIVGLKVIDEEKSAQ